MIMILSSKLISILPPRFVSSATKPFFPYPLEQVSPQTLLRSHTTFLHRDPRVGAPQRGPEVFRVYVSHSNDLRATNVFGQKAPPFKGRGTIVLIDVYMLTRR